jgi:hypothetical protein
LGKVIYLGVCFKRHLKENLLHTTNKRSVRQQASNNKPFITILSSF